jgi:heat shock protein HslJ
MLVLLISISIYLIFSFKTNINNNLNDSKWKLIEYNNQKVDYEIFLFNNKELGMNICNTISYGKVKITNDKIYFHKNAMSTLMACEEPLMTMESTIISILDEPLNYIADDEKLIITSGTTKLIFISIE